MDADAARTMNAILVALIAVVGIIAVVLAHRPASGYRRAGEWAYRARLPLDPAPLRHSIVRRFRAARIAEGWAGVVTVIVSAALLSTPLAASQFFLVTVVFPALLLTGLGASVVTGIRERLFDPAPGAPRIARLRTMSTRDYLGSARSALTWVLAAATGTLLIVALAAGRGGDAALIAVPGLLVPLGLCAALPRIERAILDRPQPASDTIELAWDDALRTDTLAAVRLSVGVACLVGMAVAICLLWVGEDSRTFAASQMIIWGQLALQIVYPPRGFAIRPALRPAPAVLA